MTLGNTPQPLTRRQLRELANENGSAASTDEPGSTSTSTQSRDASPESSFTELIQKAEAAAKAAAVPRAGERRTAAAPSDEDYFDSLDRTLTRRELRALQAAQAGENSDETDAADSGDDADVVVETDADLFVATPASAEPEAAAESAPAIPAPAATSVVPQPARFVPVIVPVPVAADADVVVVAELELDDEAENDAPRELHPPIGHWSIDPDDDVEAGTAHIHTVEQGQPFDQIIARGIGAGGVPTTTNALILPDMAHQDRASGPLASTGEILITGSIDLPRSLGSTGAHPDRFDSADVDNMLDQLDESGAASDVAPVSASRAVSSHTSTRGVMTAPKKDIAWLPTVLAITAAALALGVIALFVGAFVFKIF